jgi:hypothetical protein
LILSAVVLFTGGSWLLAAEPKPIELTLRARAIEAPILKYRLLPPEAELKPGNAAPILLRLAWNQAPWMKDVFPTLEEWESRPLNAKEWRTSAGVLPENFYREIKRAAFRRDASWEYPIGEVPSPYLILLPDAQGMRGFLKFGLSAKIRYHLSQGELDQAREGIMVGLANSRHVAQTPFLVCQLVGLTIQQTMLERTEELISQPNSPNLYWAVSSLPDSLLQWDRAASLQGDMFQMTFPAVNDLDRNRGAEEWRKMSEQLVTFLEEQNQIPKREDSDRSLTERLLAPLHIGEKSHLEKLAPVARSELPTMLGLSEDRVTAMTDDEAAIRWYAHLQMSCDQRATAVLALPPKEALPELLKLQAELNAMHEKTGTKPVEFFDPATEYARRWSLKRRIQAIRIIEAVRHHLAANDGRLPQALAEIKEIPIPVDPLSERPFEWTIDGTTATLKAPPLPAELLRFGPASAVAGPLEYRLLAK